MPSIPKMLSLSLAILGLTSLAHSTPFQPLAPAPAPAPAPAGSKTTLFEPTMYRVFPSQPTFAMDPASDLHIQSFNNQSILENIAVFENVPATAKRCTLGWSQAALAERDTFIVDGSGLLSVQQLPRLPDGAITWAAITPIVAEAVADGDPVSTPDMTSWPDIETAENHINGPMDCAETIYLKVRIDGRNGDGFVYMGQNDKNGLTITVQM
ncbi:hypothetical protein GGR50DRAFT_50034 [Xylaria sp. CBS 124048]|nr:hypothetical protein GGR50DRAFT_50034 [Xylaria sp. CBS 124048]